MEKRVSLGAEELYLPLQMRIPAHLRSPGCWACLELRGKERGLLPVGECVCHGSGCPAVCPTPPPECRGLRAPGQENGMVGPPCVSRICLGRPLGESRGPSRGPGLEERASGDSWWPGGFKAPLRGTLRANLSSQSTTAACAGFRGAKQPLRGLAGPVGIVDKNLAAVVGRVPGHRTQSDAKPAVGSEKWFFLF